MKSNELQANELRDILKAHFRWHKARLDCFVGMLLALMAVNTVNLAQLALSFQSRAKLPSRYRRLQRFFGQHWLDYDDVAGFVMKLHGFTEMDYYLTLDRTNWKFGQADINLMVLAVVWRGAAIPVYWLPLNKRGNSNSRERIAPLKRFVARFGKGRIKGLLAGREFLGDHWLGWLRAQGIPFYIRIRNNMCVGDARGGLVRVDRLFRALGPGEAMLLAGARAMGKQRVCPSGLRLADGELLVVSTASFDPAALRVYGLRWEIETLFGCLKGRGFKLEETRVVGYLRVKRLLVLPAIAFCWVQKIGEWKNDCGLPIKVKSHGRPAQSLFRYGLDAIRSALLNPLDCGRKWLKKMASLLRPPPSRQMNNYAIPEAL